MHRLSTRAVHTTFVLVVMLAAGARGSREASGSADAGCLSCHGGIEEMHPWYSLSCTACHGGDGTAVEKNRAHVRSRTPLPADERVLPLDFDPEYLQFLNPGDLRVANKACGECHTVEVEHLLRSLHCTTAGHLSDGLYENGLTSDRRARYSIFPVSDDDGVVPEHGYRRMLPFPKSPQGDPEVLAGHAVDLGRKNCMQCHLWSSGTAVQGRLGQDGDYRGAGCSACHVVYADDGLSRSQDPVSDPFEPGHPREHRMTAAPPTSTCTRCHYGDASIGLHFRGLAQLVPGMPAGPEVAGTTDSLLNGTYYINDPRVVPPDVHHAKGMHCIDCHTLRDVMGDGNLYGFMEHAVEIECTDCHGTFDRTSDLRTSRGQLLRHLGEEDGQVILTSKVDGVRHVVPQAAHVIDPARPEFNPRARAAMTSRHARLECYTCHAGWNVNFFGFHFDRNESFSDLDLLSGDRTAGRCTTQEKVFATLKHFTIGFNDEGMIAPYLVGFSTMGSVHDAEGRLVIDQQLPVTAAGLSGMTMIHHQLHSTQKVSRDCVECHRAPSTYGLGTGSFSLAREFAAVADERGVHLVAADRKSLQLSAPVSSVRLPGATAVAAQCDELQGFFQYLYVALAKAGIAVVDARNPAFPEVLRVVACEDPRDVLVRGGRLYVADGVAGVKIFDLAEPGRPVLQGTFPTAEARSLDLSWPHLYVADGGAGVKVLQVANPAEPELASHLDLNQEPGQPDDACAVRILFQYSRPDNGNGRRTEARKLAVIAGGLEGYFLFDVTRLEAPERLSPPAGKPVRRGREHYLDVQVTSRFDLGSPGGDIPTEENDYAYFTVHRGEVGQRGRGRLSVVMITRPVYPRHLKDVDVPGGASRVELASFYNPPFLQRFAVVGSPRAALAVDVSSSQAPKAAGPVFEGGLAVRDIEWEKFAFDRMIDEQGRQWKDISHEGARFFGAQELDRLLQVPLPANALTGEGGR